MLDHVSNYATDYAATKGFYAAGGKDHVAPGLRSQCHPLYYGALVPDPDGNNVEAVCHNPG